MVDRARARRRTTLGVALVALVSALAAGWLVWRARTTVHGTGAVVATDPRRLEVTISHGELAGLLPAMTTAFAVRAPELLPGITAGTRVHFDVRRQGGGMVVTRLTPIGTVAEGRPGIEDHTPHHGGVVSVYGTTHLEFVATPDGRIRVYPSDIWRSPLPPAGWGGSVTLDLPAGQQTRPLVADGDALAAQGPPLGGDAVLAHVRLAPEGAAEENAIEVHVLLPVSAAVTGASFTLPPVCVPPAVAAA
jgi:Cu/Ag efflux protein CusF